MGNSNSQSTLRFTASQHGAQTKDGRSKKQTTKFANPENRVLPSANGAQQRLRSTDNGSILQSGGTISGRKSNIHSQEPEFLQLLHKKSHPIPTSHTNGNESFKTLYGHRKSHSDPDIVRMMMCENESDEDEDDDEEDDRFFGLPEGNTRSIIAVSPSKAKIKSRKKKRAPEPPHSNTLPRSFDRIAANYGPDTEKDFSRKSDYGDTPRRPLPPIPSDELPPPPPPPPPDYNNREMIDRPIMKSLSKNYEKNRRMVDKWKFSKPVTENFIDSNKRQRSKSLDRTEEERLKNCEKTVKNDFYERKSVAKKAPVRSNESHNILSEKRPSQNELQAAIVDAARRRTERLEKGRTNNERPFNQSYDFQNHNFHNNQKQKSQTHFMENKKQFYFNDIDTMKHQKEVAHIQQSSGYMNEERKHETGMANAHLLPFVDQELRISSENINSRNEVRNLDSSKKKRKEPNMPFVTKHGKWNLLTNDPMRRFYPEGTQSSSSEEEMEIDLQLRPTLPRRPIEIPRFSPTDVWKSINLDFFKSHQQRSDVSSDECDEVFEDKIHRISRPVAPRRVNNDRSADSGISPDAGSPMPQVESFDTILRNQTSDRFKQSTPPPPPPIEGITQAWIPQHDLADDSDSCSEHAMPNSPYKTHVSPTQPKFSMPNLMFPSRSLPRTEQPGGYFEGEMYIADKEKGMKNRGRRKKSYRNVEGQHFNSLRNLKKALGLRSKSPTPVEKEGLDANWSLSRSLPNFTENLKSEAVRRQVKATPYTAIDAIRRCNSETRAHQQICNEIDKNETMLHTNMNGFNKNGNEGHVIYLPEYTSSGKKNNYNRTDEMHINTDSELVVKKTNIRKKFSYQSTVRQEEKKKLQEQLSREVEAREKQRQKEIEWMNKVEDEFRKQRDKEKINIRHQLRILNLEEKASGQKAKAEPCIAHEEMKDFNANDFYSSTPKSKTEVNGHQQIPPSLGQDSNEIDYSNWKPTGMKKWLKRQNRYSQANGFSSVRPEPEGGRSSSDDCRPLDWNHDDIAPSTLTYIRPNNADIRSKCNHDSELSCARCFPIKNISSIVKSSDGPKSSSSPEVPTPYPGDFLEKPEHLEMKKAKSQPNGSSGTSIPVKDQHEGQPVDYRFIRESVEEYEMHTRLCRTNSGRTFESHSYYALERHKDSDNSKTKVANIKQNDGKSRNNVFSTLNFENELKENVRKKSKDLEKRTRKLPSIDSDTDESGGDSNETRRGNRSARKKRESREPSFSRNHPHRSAGRKMPPSSTHYTNGRTAGFPKASNGDHRLSASVLG